MPLDLSFQKCRSEHKISHEFYVELLEIVRKHIDEFEIGQKAQIQMNIGFCITDASVSVQTTSFNNLIDPNKGAEQFC